MHRGSALLARTVEPHRAEAMKRLGASASATAELVALVLGQTARR